MEESYTSDQVLSRRLRDIILANLVNESFGVRELARESGLSRKVLGKRLHAIKKETANQFIREVRLMKALEIMQQDESLTASEVSYKTGFSSPAYFNKCFHDFFGYPPGEFKRKEENNHDPGTLTEVTYGTKAEQLSGKAHAFTLTRIITVAVLSVLTVYFIYRQINRTASSDDLVNADGRISVAVMPFRNMTNDTSLNIWQEGIQFNLIATLSNFPEELKVSQMESINNMFKSKETIDYARINPSVSGAISKSLGAKVFILGNMNKSNSIIRLNVQVINSKTGEALNSFRIDGESDNILSVIDSLSVSVQKYLLITLMKKELNREDQQYVNTKSPEAFSYYLSGVKAFVKSDFKVAIDLYQKALTIDTNYYDAFYGIYFSNVNLENWDQAKKWCLRFYRKSDQMPLIERIWINYAHARCFETPDEILKYLKLLQELDKISGDPYLLSGYTYIELKQYDKAISELEKAREQYDRWGTKPEPVWTFTTLGLAYNRTRQYQKERKLYKRAEKIYPGNPDVICGLAVLELSVGRNKMANRYLDEYISLRNGESWSQSGLALSLAKIYSESGMIDKTVKYYEEALSLDPENPDRINDLAYFLIDKDIDIERGLVLSDRSLETNPEDFRYLETRGWGLYKEGKAAEAVELLEKSWVLRRMLAVYDHSSYLHLEKAKELLAHNSPVSR